MAVAALRRSLQPDVQARTEQGGTVIEGDLDQPTRSRPARVAVLGHAAAQVLGPVLDLPRVR